LSQISNLAAFLQDQIFSFTRIW